MELKSLNNSSFGAILSPNLRSAINAYRNGIRSKVAIKHEDWLAGNFSPSRATDLDILKRLKKFSASVKFLSPKKVIQEDFYLDGHTSLLSEATREKYTSNPNGVPQINIEVLEEVVQKLKQLG